MSPLNKKAAPNVQGQQPLKILYYFLGAVTIDKSILSTTRVIKRTNEELVLQYQQGSKAAVNALYEQNTGILNRFANSYYRKHERLCVSCGVTFEDLQQEAYFAIELAAKAYKAVKGYKYVTYLHFHVKNLFNYLTGQRTQKGRQEPLSRSISLDTPLMDEESGSMADVIPDPQAEHILYGVEDTEFYIQLHNALEKAIVHLTEQQAQVIRLRFYEGKTLKEIAESTDINTLSYVRQIESNALRKMRGGQVLRELRPFVEHLNSWAYRGTGFTAWKEGGSVQERIIERVSNL